MGIKNKNCVIFTQKNPYFIFIKLECVWVYVGTHTSFKLYTLLKLFFKLIVLFKVDFRKLTIITYTLNRSNLIKDII